MCVMRQRTDGGGGGKYFNDYLRACVRVWFKGLISPRTIVSQNKTVLTLPTSRAHPRPPPLPTTRHWCSVAAFSVLGAATANDDGVFSYMFLPLSGSFPCRPWPPPRELIYNIATSAPRDSSSPRVIASQQEHVLQGFAYHNNIFMCCDII